MILNIMKKSNVLWWQAVLANEMAAGIDIHNHVRTGSSGLEDVWSTLNYIHW